MWIAWSRRPESYVKFWCPRIPSQLTLLHLFRYLRGEGGALPCCVRVRWIWLEPFVKLMSKNSISAHFYTFLIPERGGWRSSLLREGEVNLTRAFFKLMSKNSISAHFYTFLSPERWGWRSSLLCEGEWIWLELLSNWCPIIPSQLTLLHLFVTWEVRVTLLPAAWGWGEFDSSPDVQEFHLSSLLHLLLPERWGWRSSLLREGEVNLTRALMSKNSISAHFYTFCYLRGEGDAPPCCVRVRWIWPEGSRLSTSASALR